jgi:hypothetical protein
VEAVPGPTGRYGTVPDICAVIDYTGPKALGIAAYAEPPLAKNDDTGDLQRSHYREMSCLALLTQRDGAPESGMDVRVNAKVFYGTVLDGFEYDENRAVLDGEKQAAKEFDNARRVRTQMNPDDPADVAVNGVATRGYYLFISGVDVLGQQCGHPCARYYLRVVDSNLYLEMDLTVRREGKEYAASEIDAAGRQVVTALLATLRVRQ